MGSWLGETLFGNWRNKGVALFFAITIWYVAYQSEFKSRPFTIPVRLVCDQANRMIVRQTIPASQSGRGKPFNNVVNVHINGSRKQIDDFQKGVESIEGRLEISVDAGSFTGPITGPITDQYRFTEKDLSFQGFSLITVERFSPEVVEVQFDLRDERLFKVDAIYSPPHGWEVEFERVEPPSVILSGPRSILEKVEVVAEVNVEVNVGHQTDFKERVSLKILPEEIEGLKVRDIVRFTRERFVEVVVRLQSRQDRLEVDGLRVRFLVPPLKFPLRIDFEERTIPIEFRGPERDLRRLAKAVKDPDFFVAVPVQETSIDPMKETAATFTEDQLLLPGFSNDVQKHQHPERKKQGLGAWTYTVIPVRESKE